MHQFENARRGSQASLEHEVDAAECLDRFVEQKNASHQCKELRRA
jgi:hypothetical protein